MEEEHISQKFQNPKRILTAVAFQGVILKSFNIQIDALMRAPVSFFGKTRLQLMPNRAITDFNLIFDSNLWDV